jgi:hypothetical protein
VKLVHSFLPAAALVFGASLVEAQQQSPPQPFDSLGFARQVTQWFYTGQTDSLLAHLPPEERGNMTADEILDQLARLTARAGNEVEVIEEKFVMRNGHPQYWRTARFDNIDEPMLIRWVINSKLEILGAGMGPLSQAPAIDPPQ